MASGSVTRDVHLCNSIIGVYLVGYRKCLLGNPQQAFACVLSELDSANPSLGHLALHGASAGTRMHPPPLAFTGIIMHEGLFTVVGLTLYMQYLAYTKSCLAYDFAYFVMNI